MGMGGVLCTGTGASVCVRGGEGGLPSGAAVGRLLVEPSATPTLRPESQTVTMLSPPLSLQILTLVGEVNFN